MSVHARLNGIDNNKKMEDEKESQYSRYQLIRHPQNTIILSELSKVPN